LAESGASSARRRVVSGPILRRKDTIEDSEDEDEGLSRQTNRRSLPGVRNTIDVTTDLDAQFDDLFPPAPDRSKRRRVSSVVSDEEVPQHPRRTRSRQDSICSSSSSGPPSPSTGAVRQESSSPFSTSLPINQGTVATESPVSVAPFQTPRPPSSSTKTPFRSHPRFVLSSSSRPLQTVSSTPSATADTHTPSSLQQRKRPNFVLPRSPSPDADGNPDGGSGSPPPAPFSPTSHTLHGRGRPRRGALANYLPGGLAAEVRSWILEIGMRREQQHISFSAYSAQTHERYLFTARVDSCRQSMLSSGPMILTRVSLIDPNQDRDPAGMLQCPTRNVLLLGMPTSYQQTAQNPSSNPNNPLRPPSSSSSRPSLAHAAALKTGDVIGVHRGLTWEIELDVGFPDHSSAPQTLSHDKSNILNSFSPENDDDHQTSSTTNTTTTAIAAGQHKETETEKWLVAAEWDILMQS
jgi:hypothetical protein